MPSQNTSAPSWRLWAWCVVASAVVLGPNIAAVVVPFEAFPWTSAPMFAVPPTKHERAAPVFLIVDAKGESQPLNFGKVAGLSERDFARSFLRTAWGTDVDSPFDHIGDTSPEARRRRVEAYLKSVMERAIAKKHKPTMRAKLITIHVDLHDDIHDDVTGRADDDDRAVPRRREDLGSYDTASGTFRFEGEP